MQQVIANYYETNKTHIDAFIANYHTNKHTDDKLLLELVATAIANYIAKTEFNTLLTTTVDTSRVSTQQCFQAAAYYIYYSTYIS